MDDTTLVRSLQPTQYTAVMEPAERFNRYRFVLYRDGDKGNGIGRGTYFTGSQHITPWIELQPTIPFTPEQEDHQELFNALTAVLEPGSHLMVHYLQDAETAETITEDVPPPATPLGYLMWQAGVRWYKDWYFTEGWMEGDQKLQGNLPVNNDTKQEREQEWQEALETFVTDDTAHPECVDRENSLLESLDR